MVLNNFPKTNKPDLNKATVHDLIAVGIEKYDAHRLINELCDGPFPTGRWDIVKRQTGCSNKTIQLGRLYFNIEPPAFPRNCHPLHYWGFSACRLCGCDGDPKDPRSQVPCRSCSGVRLQLERFNHYRYEGNGIWRRQKPNKKIKEKRLSEAFETDLRAIYNAILDSPEPEVKWRVPWPLMLFYRKIFCNDLHNFNIGNLNLFKKG